MSANVQGIINSAKFGNKTMTTSILEENKLANAQVKFNSVGDHIINIIYSGDGVHSTVDPHDANYICNFS